MKRFLGMDAEKLGEVMRRYRVEHNFTQKKLADYLGVDRTTYSKYENERKPELDVIMKLAVLYDVSVDEFLKDFFEMKPEFTTPVSAASAPLSEEQSELDEDEKQLLIFFRECVQKKKMLEKAKEIWAEDNEIKN